MNLLKLEISLSPAPVLTDGCRAFYFAKSIAPAIPRSATPSCSLAKRVQHWTAAKRIAAIESFNI